MYHNTRFFNTRCNMYKIKPSRGPVQHNNGLSCTLLIGCGGVHEDEGVRARSRIDSTVITDSSNAMVTTVWRSLL